MTTINTIICSKCGSEIEVSEAIRHRIEEQVVGTIKTDHAKQLEEVRREVELTTKAKFEQELQISMKDKMNESQELKKRNQELQQEVLDMAKSVRELKDMASRQEIEMQKRLNTEMEKIKDSAIKMASEKSQGEVGELRKQLEDTRKALENANYKLTQTSQQMQGEVLELDLEIMLRDACPDDDIVPVAKGVKGADIIQQVKGHRSGKLAGIILWETKDAKWSQLWLSKLREDSRKAEATTSILVTKNLPDGVKDFAIIDGVIVTSVAAAIPLAHVVRRSLLQIALAKQTAEQTNENLEQLHSYLQSDAFKHRFSAFAEGINSMREDLELERRSMERVWKRREIQIQQVLTNSARMYGELQGVTGNALPEIKVLSLPGTFDVSEE